MIKLVNIPLLIISGLFFLTAQFLVSVRLNLLLRTIRLSLSFGSTFRLTMIGSFFNIVIPGTVGGDIIKGIYLFRGEEAYKGQSSGIIIMDRIIGCAALLVIGISAILYLYVAKRVVLYKAELNFLLMISFAILILLSLFVYLSRKMPVRKLASKLIHSISSFSIFFQMARAVGKLASNRRVFFEAFFISLVVQSVALMGLLMLTGLLTERLPDLHVLASISSIVLIIGIVPVTPGNIGWTELIASIGWSAVGSGSGAAIFMYWRIVGVIFSLPGAFMYFFPDLLNRGKFFPILK